MIFVDVLHFKFLDLDVLEMFRLLWIRIRNTSCLTPQFRLDRDDVVQVHPGEEGQALRRQKHQARHRQGISCSKLFFYQ